jgi:hypothetical protein
LHLNSRRQKLQHTNRDEREEELASVGVDPDGLVRLRVYWLGAADLEGRPRTGERERPCPATSADC